MPTAQLTRRREPEERTVRPPQAPVIEEPLVQIETGQPVTTAAGAEQNTTTLPG